MTISLIRRRSRQGPTNKSASRGAWLLLAGAFAAFTVSAGMMHSYAVFLRGLHRGVRAGAGPRPRSPTRCRSSSPAAARRWSVRWSTGSGRAGCWCSAEFCCFLGLVGSALMSRCGRRSCFYGVVMTIGANCLGSGGLRAAAVAALRAAARYGDLGRPVGQRLRPSGLGAGRAAADLVVRLARDLSERRPASWPLMVLPLAALFRRGDADRTACAIRRTRPRTRPAVCRWRARGLPAPSWTLSRGGAHAAFLAVVRGLPVHRARQLSGVAAPARLCRRSRLRQALCRRGARDGQLPRDRRHDRSPARCRTISGANGRRSSPTASRSSASSARCSSPTRDQHWLLWLHACFFGLTWGARGPAITAKTADLFPGRRLGTILGVITIGSGIGSAAGSWAAGLIFDLSGSYASPSCCRSSPISAAASRSGRCAARRCITRIHHGDTEVTESSFNSVLSVPLR